MTEHLFQLRKDGKVVGYLMIGKGIVFQSIENSVNPEDFDTANPFVCNDKNGKKVFGGDTISDGKITTKVENYNWLGLSQNDRKDIELIEEQE